MVNKTNVMVVSNNCMATKLGWGDANGPNLVNFNRDVQTFMPNRKEKREMLDCSSKGMAEGDEAFYYGGCEGRKTKVLLGPGPLTGMRCFLVLAAKC